MPSLALPRPEGGLQGSNLLTAWNMQDKGLAALGNPGCEEVGIVRQVNSDTNIHDTGQRYKRSLQLRTVMRSLYGSSFSISHSEGLLSQWTLT